MISLMCRVFVYNLFVKEMPKLAYNIFTTCNQFDVDIIAKYLDFVWEFHKNHINSKVGSLIGHGWDNESRRKI